MDTQSPGYHGDKLRLPALPRGQVHFASPMKLRPRAHRVSFKQRRTEDDFFLPSLSNRQRAQVVREMEPWKLSTSSLGAVRSDDGILYGPLERARHYNRQAANNSPFLAMSEDMDMLNGSLKKGYDAPIDRKIVTHLRRKLNRRVERRINLLVEKELRQEQEDFGRLPSRRSSMGAKTPFDPSNSYDEFGEKLTLTSRKPTKTATNLTGTTEHPDELNPKTPLPSIKLEDPNMQYSTASAPDEILAETEGGQTGQTFGLTGYTRGGTIAEDEPIEPSPQLESVPEVPVSPVPTPLVFRPATRHQARGSYTELRDRVLEGDLAVTVNPQPKVLRVFLLSSFADTELERTKLVETVHPKLRSYAAERGFDLHIIDPFWGYQDFVSDGHTDLDTLKKVLAKCQNQKQGVNFMIFLSQKLGDVILQTSIPVTEFEVILKEAEREKARQVAQAQERLAAYEETKRQRELEKIQERNEDDEEDPPNDPAAPPPEATVSREATDVQKDTERMKREASFLRAAKETSAIGDVDPDFLNKWYKLDQNARPPVYKLQPISSEFRDIVVTDAKRRLVARDNWQRVATRLTSMLYNLAKVTFTESELLKSYRTTLTQILLDSGFSGHLGDVSDHTVWFNRFIDNIQHGAGDERLKDFVDLNRATGQANTELQQNLRGWTDKGLPEMISKDNIHRYKISWQSKGVNLSYREHVKYVDTLCHDVTEVVTRAVDGLQTAGAAHAESKDELYREVEQHVHYCHRRCSMFQGRKNLLHAIKSYVRQTTPYPLVLYGQSGCGKTSLLAKAAKDCHKWIKGSCCVTVVRMVGVTAASTNARLLLRSLCLQLCEVFGDEPRDVPHDYKGLMNNFSFRLSNADEHRQLVIFLDSLHLMTDENEGRNLMWLPSELPPYVRMIVSTLPSEDFPCFKALKRLIPPKDHEDGFLEVNELPVADAAKVLDHWFKTSDRAVTKEQRDVMMQFYRQCQQPLYLRVLYKEALAWPSSLSASDIKIGNAVKNLATVILGRLERNHGEVLVRRALGYITASRSGITESEMEDLLSLDDAVMADVMNYIKPSLRRLPTFLWSRLREDLGDYLEETDADGCTTLKWSSIQFFQAASDRYLDNKDRAPSYHKAMSEYFSDMWTTSPKPYTGNEKGVLRYTIAQPLYREVTDRLTKETKRIYNKRRLNELPHHFLYSQQMDGLKTHCLCNFEFVLAKITGVTLRSLFEDFQMALTVEPTDADLKLLSDTLLLSVDALMKDPRQLASQVIGRMHTIVTKDVPVSYGDPVKYPFLKPFFADAQSGSVPALIPSITCLTPPGGVLFDLLSGHTEPITAICMARDGQKCVTTAKDDTLKLWELKSGRVIKTIVGVGVNVLQVEVGGNNTMVITSETSIIRIWSLRSGDCLKMIDKYQDPATIVTASERMLLVAFYHGTNVLRTWVLAGKFPLQQEVFLDEEKPKSGAIRQDNSNIVASTSNGPLVLHAFKDSNEAMVRNAKNGNVVLTLKVKESGSISALACSPEYYVVAARYQYMELHEMCCLELFDNRNGAYLRQVRGCTEDLVTELYVNHMGSHAIAICCSETNNSSDIAIWNIETQEHKHLAKHPKVSKHGACIDLRYCLTAAEGENTLRSWNLSKMVTGQGSKAKIKDGLEKLILMNDNSRYVMAKSMNNGPLSVWNIAKGKCAGNAVHIERGLVSDTDIMLIRNTKVLILTDKGFSSVSEDRPPVYQTLLIYDLLKKKYVQKLQKCFITPAPAHEYVFLNDEHVMGLADNRSHLVVWSTVTGHVISRIKPNFREFERRQRELGIVDVDMMRTQNNSTALMTPWDRRAETKSARERRHQAELDAEKARLEELRRERENAIQQYMISKDLSTVVSSHFGHHMCVFDVDSQTHTTVMEDFGSLLLLYTAALTPDGNYLVHTNYNEQEKLSYVTLWDCQTGHVRKRLRNEKNVCCIDINAQADRIVFGKNTKELRIWEPGRKNVIKRVKGYSMLNFGVNSQIHMIEEGTKAVVFAGDISIWDLVNGNVLAVFTPDMMIISFTLAMDGKLIVFGLQDMSDVVTLKLCYKNSQALDRTTGKDLFGEVESSDDEDDDLEAQLEQD